MPARDPSSVRSILLTDLDARIRRVAAVGKHLRGEDGRLDADFGDRSAYTQMDEVLEQLDDQSRAEVTAIQAALARLDDGTYGTCEACGRPIPAERLAALPTVARCVGCSG